MKRSSKLQTFSKASNRSQLNDLHKHENSFMHNQPKCQYSSLLLLFGKISNLEKANFCLARLKTFSSELSQL